MPPNKKGKKKQVKKIVTNPLEEKMAEALMGKAGIQNTDSEYGSEFNPTPRESGVDDSFADQSFQEHKEEGDEEKKLEESVDNIDTKTTVTVEENKESKESQPKQKKI